MTSVPLPTSLPATDSSSETTYESAPSHRALWTPYAPSPIMARAHEFEHGEPLSLEVARHVLRAAYNAETTPHDRWELRAVIVPRDDDASTFRIVYERVESNAGKSTASLGISDETALEYMACDYIHHRLNGAGEDAVIPRISATPALTDTLLSVTERMDALHLELLSFIVK